MMIKTEIMGILNITPDSFYDGDPNIIHSKDILEKKLNLLDKASIIDIGCESSRPKSKPISITEELNRLKIINNFNFKNKTLSIDSYKPQVIEYCLNNGFSIVNDISGGGKNFENIDIANNYNSKIILMHMKGLPLNMQDNPTYTNIVDDLNECIDTVSQWKNYLPFSTFFDDRDNVVKHNDRIWGSPND